MQPDSNLYPATWFRLEPTFKSRNHKLNAADIVTN